MNLSYMTNDQLINELLSRQTFCGILIRSTKEVREKEAHRVWQVNTTPNLEDEQVYDVLSDISEQLGEKISRLS